MAYNIPDTYKDLTPAKQLDKQTLNKMVWRSLFLQASFNFERMQAAGWLYGILPGLEKIHTDKDDLAASMSHNLEFFNTHPFLVTFVMGIILSLEQNKTDIATIRAVRVAAMGPLGGIGDALFWFTLVPITAGITSNMAISGSIAAPFIFLIIFNVAQFAVRYWLMHWSYNLGTSAIDMLTANAKEFTRAASILGIFVVGALTVQSSATATTLKIKNGSTSTTTVLEATVASEDVAMFENVINEEVLPNNDVKITYEVYGEEDVFVDIQEILDGILPKLIPFALTMLLYFLLTKRNFTPIKCILLLLVIGILGSGFGIPALPKLW